MALVIERVGEKESGRGKVGHKSRMGGGVGGGMRGRIGLYVGGE